MIRIREFAKRAALPTAALWVLESRAGNSLRAGLSKLARSRPRAELYFALDDPYSLIGLDAAQELAAMTSVDVFPVVRRGGKEGADELRRRYAVLDAGRLALRAGRPFVRSEPIPSDRVESLAAWIEAARCDGAHGELSHLLLERLWAVAGELPDFGELYALFLRKVGKPPPSQLMRHRLQLRKNEARLARRGLWDTPAVWIEGKAFFAHERREQMLDHALELGG